MSRFQRLISFSLFFKTSSVADTHHKETDLEVKTIIDLILMTD